MSPSSARPPMPIAASCAPRWTCWSWRTACSRSRARSRWRTTVTGARNSSWTDGGSEAHDQETDVGQAAPTIRAPGRWHLRRDRVVADGVAPPADADLGPGAGRRAHRARPGGSAYPGAGASDLDEARRGARVDQHAHYPRGRLLRRSHSALLVDAARQSRPDATEARAQRGELS